MILVTGANGMVGSYFPEVFKDENLWLTDIDTLDVTDAAKVMREISVKRPKIVMHLAAETNVDQCESAIDHAFRTNAMGTQSVALACQKIDSEMVYISTAAVFKGDKPDPYTEFDRPEPQSVYARSKYAGEEVVKQLLKKYYIVRAGWMIGGGKKDKKFVAKIAQLIKERDEVSAVNDKFGSPTYAKELVLGIKELIKTGFYGIYHMSNGGMISRYDMAVEIAKFYDRPIKINPVSSDAFPLPAPRGRSEAIRNMKLELLGLNRMSDWKKALRDYLESGGFQ